MRRRLAAPLTAAALFLALATAACGYSPQAADREYLRGFCRAVDEFSDALVTEGPAAAFTLFLTDLRALQAPPRLEDFHRDFVAYVEAAAADAGRVLGADPPRPDRELRSALASLEKDLEECWSPAYFEGAGP